MRLCVLVAGSLEPRLSILDFVSQLWGMESLGSQVHDLCKLCVQHTTTVFTYQSCETKSGMESLGLRLGRRYVTCVNSVFSIQPQCLHSLHPLLGSVGMVSVYFLQVKLGLGHYFFFTLGLPGHCNHFVDYKQEIKLE